MSRYLLLLVLNTPFVIAAIVSALTQYKLGHSSKRRFVSQTVLWLLVIIGLSLAQPIYAWLFTNNLTQTEPLSLFDVVQITAIVIVFYVANRNRIKIENLEQRLRSLHQELSIKLSEK